MASERTELEGLAHSTKTQYRLRQHARIWRPMTWRRARHRAQCRVHDRYGLEVASSIRRVVARRPRRNRQSRQRPNTRPTRRGAFFVCSTCDRLTVTGGGPLDGGAFDGLAHELIAEYVGEADRGDEGCILRIGRDEIFLGQLDQRFAYRRARCSEALGKLLLRQHRPRQQAAGDDLAEQGVNLHTHGLASHRSGGRGPLEMPPTVSNGAAATPPSVCVSGSA